MFISPSVSDVASTVGPKGAVLAESRFIFILANEDGSDASDKEVGKIVKVWSGLSKELFTDADNFEVTFPEGCSSGQKVNLVGATFSRQSVILRE